MSRHYRTTQGELELFKAVSESQKTPRVEPKGELNVLSLEDYEEAWWAASLKEEFPSMDAFFSAYNGHALGELCENLIGAILDKQDQLAALAAYLEKRNYDVPDVERFTPASWD
jgi:hypothetical protein